MAVISWGYSGPLYQENWARLASLGGDRYNVGPEANPFGVAAISGSRRISIGAGTALASGVLCELATMEVIDLPAIDAGTSRFYLAVLRRTWGESPVSTLELIYASAATNVTVPTAPPASFPETFTSTPGTVDDQPLAWVWYNGSDNTVKVFKISTPSAEQRVAVVESRLDEVEADTGWITLSLHPGTSVVDGLTPQIRRKNGSTSIRGRLVQTGATSFTVPSGFRPGTELRLAAVTGSSGSGVAVFVIDSTGVGFTSAGATINVNFSWIADA